MFLHDQPSCVNLFHQKHAKFAKTALFLETSIRRDKHFSLLIMSPNICKHYAINISFLITYENYLHVCGFIQKLLYYVFISCIIFIYFLLLKDTVKEVKNY